LLDFVVNQSNVMIIFVVN